MKRIFLTVLTLVLFSTFSFSNENNFLKTGTTISSAKDTKDELLAASFKEAGLTDEDVIKAIAIVNEATKKKSSIKKDSSLDKQQKAEKNKIATDEMKKELKELMGESIYKKWVVIRRSQKSGN